MAYFNYHGKIKQKILSGQLEKFEMVESHNKISPALLLYFSDGKVYPIREYMWDEYFSLISTIK
jgi:hypothetical protein